MVSLIELAELCEKATGPDRGLDAAIFCALHPGYVLNKHAPSGFVIGASGSSFKDNLIARQDMIHAGRRPSPSYTSSLDAALSLVPEDPANPGKSMLWSIAYDEDGVGGDRGYIASLGKGYHDPQFIYGHSTATPALALCAAALRARAAT